MRNSARNQSKRPDLRPAFAVMRFIRPHPGAQKGGAANLGSPSEPRRKQNLSANPKTDGEITTTIHQTPSPENRSNCFWKSLSPRKQKRGRKFLSDRVL